MGNLPFYGNSSNDVLNKINNFIVPNNLSNELKDLINLIFIVDP
jgi:hypothetical protein